MQKVYLAHSTHFDYKTLYDSIRSSLLDSKYDFILPHENSDEQFNSKELFQRERPIIVLEASFWSPGPFIEFGGGVWMLGLSGITMYNKESRFSQSLDEISQRIFIYKDYPDMISKLGSALEKVAAEL